MPKITCYGEVLWDVFPHHHKIGGAPLNVALRLQSFEHDVAMISSVGNDELGEDLLKYMTDNGLDNSLVQITNDFKTGQVQVTLNDTGSASYTIDFPAAWDNIQLTAKAIEAAKTSNAFVFGSLAARNKVSRKTLLELLPHANYKVFDLNLRPPHYTKELLIDLMHKADFIKFNDEELYEASGYLGSKHRSLEQNMHFVSQKTNTKHICVTKGNHGAVLLYNGKCYYNSGYFIKVADTVGAGDSFLASLISRLLNKANPQEAIDFACAIGAMVAQSEGANPILSPLDIASFMHPV